MLLGYSSSILLRPHPSPSHAFQVVIYNVYGLHGSLALLSPFSAGWKVSVVWDLARYVYVDAVAGEMVFQDPRLGPLPEGWARFQKERTADVLEIYEWFKNERTAEQVNADSRLLPDASTERGVDLLRFSLV